MIGRGTFTISEASQLTKVSATQLRRWFGATNAIFPAARWGRDVNLSFADLISAMVVHALRERGVKMSKIRRIAAKAAKELGTERPFAVNLLTDGQTIFRSLRRRGRPRSRHLIDLDLDQAVIEPFLRPFLRHIEFGAEAAERRWPFGKRAGVVVDPAYSMGAPVTADHRIPTKVLYAARMAGEAPQRIADWYEIPKAEVLRAVRFEKKLRSQAA